MNEPRRLKNPIPVARDDWVHYWKCGHCGATRAVVNKDKNSNELPPGWIWLSYHSARFPDHDSAALGCCADHAAQAAAKFAADAARAVAEGFTPVRKS